MLGKAMVEQEQKNFLAADLCGAWGCELAG